MQNAFVATSKYRLSLMPCKLFIGGLSWNTSDDSLRAKFEEFGAVEEAIVIKDRETGRSRGFGFVTFQDDNEAQTALDAMNNQELDGRPIRVDKAGDRPEGGDRSSFRPRGGRTGGYGGDRGDRSSFRPRGGRTGGYGSGSGSGSSTGSERERSSGYGSARSYDDRRSYRRED